MTEGEVKLLSRFIISINYKEGQFRFEIPDIGIKTTDGIISKELIEEHKKDKTELVDGENWGVVTLIYIQPVGNKRGHIELRKLVPFRPYNPNLDFYKECRKNFSTEEWIDVLISAMEYNPDGFEGTEQKVEFLSR